MQNSMNLNQRTDSSFPREEGISKANEIQDLLEEVERDSHSIADSVASLFSSLRTALSEITVSSTDHIQCLNDATGHLQESVLDATTKGNRLISSCLRLNEEMKDIEQLTKRIKVLKRTVDALDAAITKHI